MVTAGRTARSAGGASADVPSSIENVNAEWLTAVLDGGTVTDIRTERIAEAAGQALQALTEDSMLLHGDIRADNMFFDGDQLKVVDFQFAARGAGAADIAYLVSQGLPTEVRRGHDEALIREYLACLSARGVMDYAFDEAWRHYRCGGLPHDPARDHPQRLGRLAGALPCIVREAHRPRGGDHRRDRRAGGVRMTRSAREVVELYNLVVWNERDFALAEELMGDTVVRHEKGRGQYVDPRRGRPPHRRHVGSVR